MWWVGCDRVGLVFLVFFWVVGVYGVGDWEFRGGGLDVVFRHTAIATVSRYCCLPCFIFY